MIKKIIGIFIILIGFSGIVSFFETKDFFDFFLAFGLILIGIRFIKNSKKKHSSGKDSDDKSLKKSWFEKTKNNKEKPKPKKQIYTFNVAGVTKKNNEGKSIQKIISQHVKDEISLYGEPYEGLKNKEILEQYDYDEKIYEADAYGYDELKFEFEPMNKYDANAIKVVHEELGHIGYVPKANNVKVADIIKNKEYEIYWEVVGGKYKYIDEYEDKVLTEKDTYGVKIELTY